MSDQPPGTPPKSPPKEKDTLISPRNINKKRRTSSESGAVRRTSDYQRPGASAENPSRSLRHTQASNTSRQLSLSTGSQPSTSYSSRTSTPNASRQLSPSVSSQPSTSYSLPETRTATPKASRRSSTSTGSQPSTSYALPDTRTSAQHACRRLFRFTQPRPPTSYSLPETRTATPNVGRQFLIPMGFQSSQISPRREVRFSLPEKPSYSEIAARLTQLDTSPSPSPPNSPDKQVPTDSPKSPRQVASSPSEASGQSIPKKSLLKPRSRYESRENDPPSLMSVFEKNISLAIVQYSQPNSFQMSTNSVHTVDNTSPTQSITSTVTVPGEIPRVIYIQPPPSDDPGYVGAPPQQVNVSFRGISTIMSNYLRDTDPTSIPNYPQLEAVDAAQQMYPPTTYQAPAGIPQRAGLLSQYSSAGNSGNPQQQVPLSVNVTKSADAVKILASIQDLLPLPAPPDPIPMPPSYYQKTSESAAATAAVASTTPTYSHISSQTLQQAGLAHGVQRSDPIPILPSWQIPPEGAAAGVLRSSSYGGFSSGTMQQPELSHFAQGATSQSIPMPSSWSTNTDNAVSLAPTSIGYGDFPLEFMQQPPYSTRYSTSQTISMSASSSRAPEVIASTGFIPRSGRYSRVPMDTRQQLGPLHVHTSETIPMPPLWPRTSEVTAATGAIPKSRSYGHFSMDTRQQPAPSHIIRETSETIPMPPLWPRTSEVTAATGAIPRSRSYGHFPMDTRQQRAPSHVIWETSESMPMSASLSRTSEVIAATGAILRSGSYSDFPMGTMDVFQESSEPPPLVPWSSISERAAGVFSSSTYGDFCRGTMSHTGPPHTGPPHFAPGINAAAPLLPQQHPLEAPVPPIAGVPTPYEYVSLESLQRGITSIQSGSNRPRRARKQTYPKKKQEEKK